MKITLALGAGALVLALAGCDKSAPGAASSTTSASASAPATSATGTATSSVLPAVSGSAKPAAPKADPSRLKLSGKAIQGGLLQAQVEPATRGVQFPGHKVVISKEGDFLIAFYRNAPKEETLTITFPDGAQLEHLFEIEQRSYDKDVINGLPEKWVKLDPETKRKLHLANSRVEKARNRYTETPFYKDGFVWPVTGKITSRYGQPRVLNGIESGIHWGIDIAAPVGTPVKAPAGGTVSFVETAIPLSGHVLVIDHGHGLSSTFLHLGGFTKKVGDEVAQGDVVASVGMTGRTNGAHLDWRMNYFKIRIDPELLVPPLGGAAPQEDTATAQPAGE